MAFETRSRRVSVCIWRVAINKAFWAQDGSDVGFFCLLKQIERHASSGPAKERVRSGQWSRSLGIMGVEGKDLSVILSGEKREIIPKKLAMLLSPSNASLKQCNQSRNRVARLSACVLLPECAGRDSEAS
jgi:hypothetical protein